jgi:hypothetical protein
MVHGGRNHFRTPRRRRCYHGIYLPEGSLAAQAYLSGVVGDLTRRPSAASRRRTRSTPPSTRSTETPEDRLELLAACRERATEILSDPDGDDRALGEVVRLAEQVRVGRGVRARHGARDPRTCRHVRRTGSEADGR